MQERIRFLDQAENRWFPRARNAIRRFVAPAEREKVENAFFTDMSQRPEGPLVIASMEKLMVRLEGLRQSNVPGAKDAYTSLERRGLTGSLIQEIKDTIARCKSAMESLPPAARTGPDSAEVALPWKHRQINPHFRGAVKISPVGGRAKICGGQTSGGPGRGPRAGLAGSGCRGGPAGWTAAKGEGVRPPSPSADPPCPRRTGRRWQRSVSRSPGKARQRVGRGCQRRQPALGSWVQGE